MLDRQSYKDPFQYSTNYNNLPNTAQVSSDQSNYSQYKQYIFKERRTVVDYVSKVFNDIKNHAVRFQISKINQSYALKPINKQGIYDLHKFVQNLLVFYKKTIQKSRIKAEIIQNTINFIEFIKQKAQASKQQLLSDSQAVKNIQRISHILSTTMAHLLNCFEVKDLTLTGYLKYAEIFNCLISQIQQMIDGDSFVQRISYYDPYSLPTVNQKKNPMAETIKTPRSGPSIKYEQQHSSQNPHYLPKERIHFNKQLTPQAIDYIYPSHHRDYICEAAKAYSTITPIRVNKINVDRFPKFQNFESIFDISNDSYFQGEETAPIVYHLIPGTNKMSYYNLSMIQDALNLTHQYEMNKEMPIEGNFSQYTQSCISPYGSVFITNVHTTSKNHDLNFWQYKFSSGLIKKRAPIPNPRKQHGIVFLNNFIFVIGGSCPTSKALKTVDKYNIKTKLWSAAGNMQVGVTNPTVCTFRNRYIFSCCGKNEFDFISNRFEVYDSVYDGWTIVKTITNQLFKNLELLNGGSAIAINPEVIYIFGGNRNTDFQHDTDFALLVNEVVEVKKKPSRVSAELVPTGGEKRAILSYAGTFKANSGVIHNNSIYFLRKDIY